MPKPDLKSLVIYLEKVKHGEKKGFSGRQTSYYKESIELYYWLI